jgi:hypothetical protein
MALSPAEVAVAPRTEKGRLAAGQERRLFAGERREAARDDGHDAPEDDCIAAGADPVPNGILAEPTSDQLRRGRHRALPARQPHDLPLRVAANVQLAPACKSTLHFPALVAANSKLAGGAPASWTLSAKKSVACWRCAPADPVTR